MAVKRKDDSRSHRYRRGGLRGHRERLGASERPYGVSRPAHTTAAASAGLIQAHGTSPGNRALRNAGTIRPASSCPRDGDPDAGRCGDRLRSARRKPDRSRSTLIDILRSRLAPGAAFDPGGGTHTEIPYRCIFVGKMLPPFLVTITARSYCATMLPSTLRASHSLAM